ncbi:MAG TPA: fused MFS/spermidine synthase [Candidatus Dormibacteraeota bacterium]
MTHTRRLVLPLVFVSGMASLGIEFSAARLLAPYFGTSLYVWGVLIGLILLYLSAGYILGGRLADRRPEAELLFQLTAWAGLWVGVVPLVSYPILLASQRGFATVSAGLVLGTLLAVLLLFAVPVILLGCVSPFAIRLLLTDVRRGGDVAGRVYALSTAGSILGTFLPVFWFIPSYGTRPTLVGFAAALVVISALALWPRRRLYAAFAAVLALTWLFLPSGIKPPQQGRLLYERDSAYNYIQVVQVGDTTELMLNEGLAIHSEYRPDGDVGGYWPLFLVSPAFRPAGASWISPRRVAILGLAGGTTATELTAAYPGVDVTGVEIDPALVDVARSYFHLTQPNVHSVVADARYWLATRAGAYDLISIDAYRQPYIPFHLTTEEFFESVRDHLAPGGVVAVNVGRTATDYRLVAAIAQTLRAVFPSVFLVDVPAWDNTVVYASTATVSLADVTHNLQLPAPECVEVAAQETLASGSLRVSPYAGPPFTDDLAPVERLIDEIIFGYVTGR